MAMPKEPRTDLAGKPDRAAANGSSGHTGRLATWLARTTLEDILVAVREHAKLLLPGGVACALVGARRPVLGAIFGYETGHSKP
jgi:hypothetical protein